MTVVAVIDVGKTNVKLSAARRDGALVETLATSNEVRPGPPYRHHDLAALEVWLLAGLRSLGTRYDIEALVACGHGSGGVLVGADGPALPMVDYEQDVPAEVEAEYRRIAGSYRERGSAIMPGATHLARQMLWMARGWPDAFAKARAYLALPQYWAWRLSGVAASEVTSLAAQSHLWSPLGGAPAALVAAQGWSPLMPPLQPAWRTLGVISPVVAAQTGLARHTRVLCGIHDSSANFYRYQAAGLSDLTVISTGTWIVALTDRQSGALDSERPGHTCNADVFGRPMPGMLAMGGREFQAVAGGEPGPARRDVLHRIVASRTFALPSFGFDDGIFPGSARQGRLHGPMAEDREARVTLAVLHAALLTAACLEQLPAAKTIVLDGAFVRDPLYAALVQALAPGSRVRVSREAAGTAAGAALLATHETRVAPAPLSLDAPETDGLPDLAAYRADWRAQVDGLRPP